MKNEVFDCEVVAEMTLADGKVAENKVIVPRYEVFAENAEAAKLTANRTHGEAIISAEKAGYEVEVKVRPFCG